MAVRSVGRESMRLSFLKVNEHQEATRTPTARAISRLTGKRLSRPTPDQPLSLIEQRAILHDGNNDADDC